MPLFDTGSWYIFSYAYGNENGTWAHSTVNNHWYDSPTNSQSVTVTTYKPAWQEYHDNSKNNMCATLNYGGGNNFIDDTTCAGKASQLWWSYETNIYYDGNYVWIIYNEYTNENDSQYCNGHYYEAVTALAASSDLIMQCPLGGTGSYAPDQGWEYGT